MCKHFILLMIAAFFIASCGQAPREAAEEAEPAELPPEESAFMDNLTSLCGQSFPGEEAYLAEGRESWEGDYVMHVTLCEEDRVHIPFHVGEDHSRTWMFINEDGRLRFRHDHRHPDGSPEEQTLYGGYSDGQGTAFEQHFPRDEYSAELLEGDYGREWRVVMDEAMTTFSYRLLYDGELVFQADFDLTNPL